MEIQRRSSFNIAIGILKLCLEPSIKTRVIYQANINQYLFYRYTKVLENEGLLKREGKKWKTTEKGIRLLGHARDITLLAPCLLTSMN